MALLTWIQAEVCCRGEVKKVPSISGYLKHGTTPLPASPLWLSRSLLPLKDDHLVVAENTGNFIHLVSCIARENEAPRLIVPNAALILHLGAFIFKTFPNLF